MSYDMSDTVSEVSEDFREAEPVERRTIDAHVSDYFLHGDEGGLNYDNHFFTVHVRVENLFYTVDRSYIDFVELDRRLRKRFPRSNIMALPLEAAEMLEKVLSERERGSKRRVAKESGLSLSAARDAILTGWEASNSPLNAITNLFRVKEKFKENFHEKVSSLDTYLVSLLTLSEVVASDDIMLFLDEEASSMDVDPDSLLPLSEHDLMLLNMPLVKCTVRRMEEKTLQVQAGQFVLWRFNTTDFDIGFSVELNGDIKIPYTRYKSHEKTICGTLEVTQSGNCILKWDNSYARLRTKQLTWVARVVKDKDYHLARAQALEIQREKKKFEDQRHALRRCAVTHAALLSGVMINPSIVSEHAHEEKLRIRELEEEITSLKNNLRLYQQDIENGQLELDALEEDLATMQKSRQLINESWQFSVKQLESAQSETKVLHQENNVLKASEKSLKLKMKQLESDLKKLGEELQRSTSTNGEMTEYYKNELEKEKQNQEMMKLSYENILADFEKRIQKEVDKVKLETEEHVKLDYEEQIQDLHNLCQTLEQRFLKATTPKDVDNLGFFVDTVSEIELSNRLVQLEKENAFLENQRDILEHDLKQAKKQIEELNHRNGFT